MITKLEDRFSEKELFDMFNIDVPCKKVTVDLWTVRKPRRKVDTRKRKTTEQDNARIRKHRVEVYSMLKGFANAFEAE